MAMRRVERVSSVTLSSSSRPEICRLIAADEMRSCLAAADSVPLSTTRTKVAMRARTSMGSKARWAILNLDARVPYLSLPYRRRRGDRTVAPMNKSFAGKVVLVTGANSGIGETAAALFAEEGATVVGTARRTEALEAARARHPRVKWVLVDVTSADAVKEAVEGIVRTEGRLDVLVNNAGTFTFGPLEQASEQMMRPQFETNVYGTVYATVAALPALKASRGSIVNIGSAAGHKPVPGGSIYGATKAAVEQASEQMMRTPRSSRRTSTARCTRRWRRSRADLRRGRRHGPDVSGVAAR